MNIRLNYVVASVAFCALPLVASAALESPLYTADFDLANGAQPVDWNPVLIGSNELQIHNKEYRFRRPAGGSGMAMTSIYDGAGSSLWTDYRVDTVFSVSHATVSSTTGLVARWNGPVPTTPNTYANAYFAYVSAASAEDSRANLHIVKGISTNRSMQVLHSEVVDIDFLANTDYYMSFEVVGARLTLTFGNADQSETYSISVIDTTDPYLSGQAGLRAYQASNSRDASFNSFTVVQVPEPSTAAALAAGAVLACCLIGKKRMRRRTGSV